MSTSATTGLEARLPFTARHPNLGSGPLSVDPIINPELYELERERLFKKVWLKVGRVEEIPQPGDFKVKRLDVARTSAILVRGKDGQVRAFHNICPHRGNKVVPETGGNETFGKARANVLTCRFHGWVFATDGPVKSIPREENFANIDRACLGLRPMHCDVWQGFIFINLDDKPEQTLAEYLGGMGDHFAGYPYGESTVSYRYYSVLNCNWKVALYAFTEGYHVATIHAATFPSLAKLEHQHFTLYGPHSTSTLFVPPVEGLKPTAATAVFGKLLRESETHRPRLDQLPPKINAERRNDFQFEFPTFFPNFLIHLAAGNGYPGMTYFTHQFWPLAHNKTLWEGINYFRPPTKPSERIAIAHVNALHRNAWLEDTSTMEDTQDALESRVLTEMVLMDEELMIRNTDHYWHKYLGLK